MKRSQPKVDVPKKVKPFHSVEPIIMDNAIMREESMSKIYSDVNGSYTGRPIDGGTPEQDADDL